jgi:hypothetical protein
MIEVSLRLESCVFIGSPPETKKACKQIRVSTGGFAFTTFRKSSHDSLEEGRGYAVGFTWINRNKADSSELGTKTGFLSRGIALCSKPSRLKVAAPLSKIWWYLDAATTN